MRLDLAGQGLIPQTGKVTEQFSLNYYRPFCNFVNIDESGKPKYPEKKLEVRAYPAKKSIPYLGGAKARLMANMST